MGVRRHIHALAPEPDTLDLQPPALLESGLPLEADGAAGPEDTLPRQNVTHLTENPDH